MATETDRAWALVNAALETPSWDAWAQLARTLHRWPDPQQLHAEVLPRCRQRLQSWPASLQRTPLRPWLEPELAGDPPHPLMSLTHAPGGWLLDISVIIGQLSDGKRRHLSSLEDLQADIEALFGDVFHILCPAFGQNLQREAYAEEHGIVVKVSLSVVHRGWEVQQRRHTATLDTTLSMPDLAAPLRGMREPEGAAWHRFSTATALHAWESRPPDALDSPWFRQDHFGLSGVSLRQLPRGTRSRPHQVRAEEMRVLVSEQGKIAVYAFRSQGKPSRTEIPRSYDGLGLHVSSPPHHVLWRGPDRLELYDLRRAARLRTWHWAGPATPPWPASLRHVRIARAGPNAGWRDHHVLDFGAAHQTRWSGQDGTIRPAQPPSTPTRAHPFVDLLSPELADQVAGVVEQLGAWTGDRSTVAELADLHALRNVSARAQAMQNTLDALGQISSSRINELLIGILGTDTARERRCRAALDQLLGDGLLALLDDEHAEPLLLLGWATRLGQSASAVGAALSAALLTLDSVDDLFCDDLTLGKVVLSHG